MSAWSDLPNAYHIDRVLASLKEHTRVWRVTRNASVERARVAAYNAAYDAGRIEAWTAALNAPEWASTSHVAAWDAGSGSLLALVAYDDCDQYLSMTSKQLRTWAILTEQPAAMLLLPAVIAFERIKKLESV